MWSTLIIAFILFLLFCNCLLQPLVNVVHFSFISSSTNSLRVSSGSWLKFILLSFSNYVLSKSCRMLSWMSFLPFSLTCFFYTPLMVFYSRTFEYYSTLIGVPIFSFAKITLESLGSSKFSSFPDFIFWMLMMPWCA